jgi:hypothetical protein
MAKSIGSVSTDAIKAIEFLKSQVSRVSRPPVPQEVSDMRHKSCFGGGNECCPNLKDSIARPGFHVCGACGCGEHKILEDAIPRFPYLTCPLGKPGFNAVRGGNIIGMNDNDIV